MDIIAFGIGAIEHGLVPDVMTRHAIRKLCRGRIRQSTHVSGCLSDSSRAAFLQSLRDGPIAIAPDTANQQHYELPPEFFAAILGPRKKYSCCYFSHDEATLAEAEEAALKISCEWADIADGQRILELGCGWGSLTFWMAERFRHSQITAVSNSHLQRQLIEAEAQARGVTNVRAVTCDMNTFSPKEPGFDRIVSVEMFEHMRNYDCLLRRIASWLKPDGKLFIHMFCHDHLLYPFDTDGAANWMGRYFFTGGMMPSANLLQEIAGPLVVTRYNKWNGCHYQRTAEAWLANLDAHDEEIVKILAKAYGPAHVRRWRNRWRMFFLAVAELFGFAGGKEWYVSHYVMEHSARVTQHSSDGSRL